MDNKNGNVDAKPKLMVLPLESLVAPTDGISTYLRSDVYRKSNIIKVTELGDYIENNSQQINDEFISVPRCKYYKCSIARMPENVLKRHRLYISEAYDYNRVVLKLLSDENEDYESSNDYIAANHVDSYAVRKRFIATQAPLPQTIADHWRMIWDYNCSQIITLTKLIEDGFYKADKYWPDEHFVKYGDISVVHKNTKFHKDFEVLTYELENNSENSEKREIEHYFYSSWPDCKSPTGLDSLFDLIEIMRHSKFHTPNKPVVVHCGAGVGRTGTFILIYNMIEMGEQCGYVDFYKNFIKLRCQRAYSVFSFEQYLYAHKFIANYFSKK